MSVFEKFVYIRIMKHSLVRETIVKTASDLFYKKGYNLTGINEIIKEAGIAKATLYNHFKSKDDICLAYLKYKNDTFLSQIKIYTLNQPKGKQQILAIFDFLHSFFTDTDFNGCWCIKTVAEIPMENKTIRHEIQNEKKEFIALITKLIVANIPNKSEKEYTILARQIYVLYEGAVAESHLHQASWPISSAKEICNILLT